MNSIHKKRLKRKRKLEGRIECHGNTSSCKLEHPIRKEPKPILVVRKEKWYNKLIEWLKTLLK